MSINPVELKHKNITEKILHEVGLLLNFGPKPDFRRKAYDNSRKTPTWEQK
jgi:hypothetical protein